MSWTNTSFPLSTGVGSPSTAVWEDYLYSIGGRTSSADPNALTNVVQFTKLDAQGNMTQPWALAGNMSLGCYRNGVLVIENKMYIFGGSLNGTGAKMSNIQIASLSPDGTVGSWTASAMPLALDQMGVTYWNGFVYIIGGNTGSSSFDIYRARIDGSGNLGAWSVVGYLPANTAGASCWRMPTLKNLVYLSDPTTTNKFCVGLINENGSISWDVTDPVGYTAVGGGVRISMTNSRTIYTNAFSTSGVLVRLDDTGRKMQGFNWGLRGLDSTISSATMVTIKNKIFILGGVLAPGYTTNILVAPILDGAPGGERF